ncbi:hypothetical protein MXB_2356 [Myxobolus squamalis]|nr:hypothetical protein MXB_2356 [Myxobolus squamalis]
MKIILMQIWLEATTIPITPFKMHSTHTATTTIHVFPNYSPILVRIFIKPNFLTLVITVSCPICKLNKLRLQKIPKKT